MNILVNGEIVDTISADVLGYTRYSYALDLEAGANEIGFSASGADDTYGPLIDNVSLMGEIDETATVTIEVQGLSDIAAADDAITVYETETAGDIETLDTGETTILANDSIAPMVVSLNGIAGQVGQWIDLDKGRVMVNADGSVDFDANGDFDALMDGDCEDVVLTYGIGTNDTGNLIVNGGFEAHGALNRGSAKNSWDVFEAIPGWTTPTGALEIQQGTHGGTPVNADTNSVVELDSHDQADTNAGIAQSVDVPEAGSYTLSFDYSPRQKGALIAETSTLNILVNGEIVDTISADVLGYETYSYTLELASGADDTYGPLLDNVALTGAIPETAKVLVTVKGLTDREAADDRITVYEDETAGDRETLESGATHILENDTNPDGVVTVNGQAGAVAEWIDLAEGGRAIVYADGTVDFDADGDFDDLDEGESTEVALTYSVGETRTGSGAQAEARVTVEILGITERSGFEGVFWEETTGNAVQDGDAGLAGQKVVLLDAAGAPVLNAAGQPISTTTDTDGSYTFGDLDEGSYRIGFEQPEGLDFVEKGADLDGDGNSDDATASDVDPDQAGQTVTLEGTDHFVFVTDVLTLAEGQTMTDVNAGAAAAATNTPPEALNDVEGPIDSPDLIDPFGNAFDYNAALNVLSNDSDPDGDAIRIVRVGTDTTTDAQGWFDWQDGSDGGELRINQDGRFQIRDEDYFFETLEVGEMVTTGIDYEITDDKGEFATATAAFEIVGAVDDGPVLPPFEGGFFF